MEDRPRRPRPWPWARSRRRRRSRCSAPTAAASSTPTRRTPYENPTPLTNFLQMLSIFLIPAALCMPSAAWWATTPGLGGAGGDDGDLRRRRASPHIGRAAGQPAAGAALGVTRRPAPAVGRQHGRQGRCASASPPPPVRHHHHGRLLRRGESHARLVHAARRHGAAGDDAARRSGVRRCRLRASTACWSSPSWRCSSPA
jgi:hypothetical protein